MTVEVDLAEFPIIAADVPTNEPPHVRMKAITAAINRALALKDDGVHLDGKANYATLSAIAGPTEPIEFRARINGFIFGSGSKKDIEYVAVSWVGLDAKKAVASWSEDLQAFEGTAEYWKALREGRPAPKPPKPKAKDCAKLAFVAADGKPVAITDDLRALVAKHAAQAPAVARSMKTDTKAKKK